MHLSSIIYALIPFYGSNVRFRLSLRLREFFRKHKMIFMAKCLKSYILQKYGCELSINAEISPRAQFMHTVGVVIGDGCKVYPSVIIYSNVVLGRKNIYIENDYPTIKNNVVLCNGATILGKVLIVENTIIGAKSLVTSNILTVGTYAGIPAKKIK